MSQRHRQSFVGGFRCQPFPRACRAVSGARAPLGPEHHWPSQVCRRSPTSTARRHGALQAPSNPGRSAAARASSWLIPLAPAVPCSVAGMEPRRSPRPALASCMEQPVEGAFQRPKGTAQGHSAAACNQGPQVHPTGCWAAPAAGPEKLLGKGCSTWQGIAVGKHCAPRPALAAIQGEGRFAGNYLVRSKLIKTQQIPVLLASK